MARSQDDHLWALVQAERAALAQDLAGLNPEQWRHGTLCGEWVVEQVVAHLTAAASLTQRQWLRSMLVARFRPDVHNQRQLARHRGRTPAGTLDRFRAVITSTTAPSSHTRAHLGEVVVHAQDIRRPLGLARAPGIDALTPVADFFAGRNFAVASRLLTDKSSRPVEFELGNTLYMVLFDATLNNDPSGYERFRQWFCDA